MANKIDTGGSSLTAKIVVVTGLIIAITGLVSALTDANLFALMANGFKGGPTEITKDPPDDPPKEKEDVVPPTSLPGNGIWSNGRGVKLDGADIIRNGGSTKWVGTTSVKILRPGKKGSITYKVVDQKQIAGFGLSTSKVISSWENLKAGLIYQQGFGEKIQVNPVKSGILYGTPFNGLKNDELKIIKLPSGKVTIYRNGEEMITFTTTPDEILYLGAVIQTNGGMLRGIQLTGDWNGT